MGYFLLNKGLRSIFGLASQWVAVVSRWVRGSWRGSSSADDPAAWHPHCQPLVEVKPPLTTRSSNYCTALILGALLLYASSLQHARQSGSVVLSQGLHLVSLLACASASLSNLLHYALSGFPPSSLQRLCNSLCIERSHQINMDAFRQGPPALIWPHFLIRSSIIAFSSRTGLAIQSVLTLLRLHSQPLILPLVSHPFLFASPLGLSRSPCRHSVGEQEPLKYWVLRTSN